VSFLAKTSEYKDSLHRRALRLFRSIPVRRHEIDPSAIRNALKVLRVGEPVGIFLEGERTWDGKFLAPKIGTVRFLLAAGVPVLPVRIKGSFELLPRWDSRLQKHKVTLTVGEPFLLTFQDDEVEEAGQFVMNRLARL
jgi:1-acyl-sn-glycerol-3-phosphate acyltransferase